MAKSSSRKQLPSTALLICILGMVVAVVAVYLWRQLMPQSYSYAQMQEIAANQVGVSPDVYRRLTTSVDDIRQARGEVSNDTVNFLVNQYKTGNDSVQHIALTAMSRIRADHPRGQEFVGYAKDFLNRPREEGFVGAVQLLKKFGDSSWKGYAERFSRSANPETAAAARRLLEAQ